jgi:carbon storage regulator
VLILSRKAEQGIVIDGVTVVRVLSIDGDRVKLGIDAPASISILREELLQDVGDENRQASRPARDPRVVNRMRDLSRGAQPPDARAQQQRPPTPAEPEDDSPSGTA